MSYNRNKKCYACGRMTDDITEHKALYCKKRGGGGHSGTVRCYDCSAQVPDLRAHRAACPNSRRNKNKLTNYGETVMQAVHERTVTMGVAASAPKLSKQDKAARIAKSQDVYFLLDVSGSMDWHGKLDEAKAALIERVAEMDPYDRFSLTCFDNNAYMKIKPRAVEQLQRQGEFEPLLGGIFAQGGTALYDAICLDVTDIQKYNKAAKNGNIRLIVLTDGEDRDSKHTLADALAMVERFPNIKLDIVHIEDYGKRNPDYDILCRGRGQYIVIEETTIRTTIKRVFVEG